MLLQLFKRLFYKQNVLFNIQYEYYQIKYLVDFTDLYLYKYILNYITINILFNNLVFKINDNSFDLLSHCISYTVKYNGYINYNINVIKLLNFIKYIKTNKNKHLLIYHLIICNNNKIYIKIYDKSKLCIKIFELI